MKINSFVHSPTHYHLSMKKLFLILVLLCMAERPYAQTENINTGHGIGFQLNQYQNDFGFGLQYMTPLFFNSIGVRAKYNLMFHEHVKDSMMTWTPYSNLSLGLIGFSGMVSERIRLYGEGGLLLILPSSAFSTSAFDLGGYGLFGFEFFTTNSFNYFIEIGGVGSGAVADKLTYQPIYSNGLSITTGFRIIFP